MSQYKLIIDQKDYCDESDLLISQYNQTPSIHFQSEIQFINKWIITESNAPLLVLGDGESGKKTLLCSFLKESKDAHRNWLHLCHFSSITPQYSHILYKIMIELRNYYKIQQRVDLNDEKLRRYLKYWLEVVSELIDKEYLGYIKSQIPKVVIIIQGIDECLDIKGNFVDTQFWLPSNIPSNIKLILTAKAIKEQEMHKATILCHHLSHEKRLKIISQFQEKAKILYSSNKNLSLYHIHIMDKMLKIKPNFSCDGTNISEIVNQYIQAVSTSTLSTEEIKSILYILTLTRKGLRQKWIQKIVNITQQKWGLFLRFFSFFIVESKTYYIICNKSAKRIIKNIVDHSGQKEKTYRHSISYSIRNEAVHLRELQEIVHQLYLSESFNELKEVISSVQNFAMLYTPLSKDLLCKCWVKLEQLEQYDPVFQYNKAIEAYKSHYYPKEQDLYKIIFQISMFFKEYAQFENARTPEFRHPLIKGEMDQLVEIGIYEQLKSLAMIGRCKIYKLKPLQKFSKKNDTLPKEEVKKENKKQEHSLQEEEKEKIHTKGKSKRSKKDRESEIVEHSRPQTSSSKEQPVPTQTTLNIEELNVSIYANQQKFRGFFTKSMKEYLENNFTPLKKNGHRQKQLSFQSDESENEQEQAKQKQNKELRIDIEKLKDSLILKKFREYLEENYHKTGEEVRFYYYKQWIWLQFPWICQTVKNIYSQMIKECLPGSIHFMSPLQEFQFVREVLKIARTAKESKLNIFTDKKIEVLPLRYSPQKLQQLQSQTKFKSPDHALFNSSKTKRVQDIQSTKGLNLETIDNMIFKEKQFEQNYKDKTKGLSKNFRDSVPNLNMFVTQTTQKAKLLPYLSKSKFVKESRNKNREKQNANESKDLTMTVRKYNEIKHENDMLIQKIQEMKKLSSIQISKTKEEQEYILSHIQNIQEKKEGLEKSYHHQSLLQKKLELIIKICDLNKMYGSQSEYLSTYLNSLKQMILLEQTRVKQIKTKITEFMDGSKCQIKRLKAKRKELKSIKEEHDRIYVNLGTDSTSPQYISMPLEQIQQELRQMEKTVKNKSKKEKSKMQHFLSSEDYQILEEKLGIVYGESGNEEKIKDFLDKEQKKKELNLQNGQLNLEIKKYKQQISSLKSNLQNYKQLGLNEKRFNATNTLIDMKRLLSDVRNRNSLLMQAIETVSVKD